MAGLVLQDGETVLLKEIAEGVRDGMRSPGFVILTDRRVAVVVGKRSKMYGGIGTNWMAWTSWLVRSLIDAAQQAAPMQMTHQIDREDFDAVESQGKQMLSFHSKGEGYSHISFVVYSQTPFEVWQRRIHRWASGSWSAAEIPIATVIER
jgi:hypothetical protein